MYPNFDIQPKTSQSELFQFHLHKVSVEILKLTSKKNDMPKGIINEARNIYAESRSGEDHVVLERLQNQIQIRGNVFNNIKKVILPQFMREETVSKYHIENKGNMTNINIGDGENVISNFQNQILNDPDKKIALLNDLETLINFIDPKVRNKSQSLEAVAVREAALAVKNDDHPRFINALKCTGKWTLDMAAKIGVPLATSAIKDALGIGGSNSG